MSIFFQHFKNLKTFKPNLILAALICFATLLPNYLILLFGDFKPIPFKAPYVAALFAFYFFLVSSQNKKFIYIILGFFMVLELIQYAHLAYFGSFISPFEFHLIGQEWEEIGLAAVGSMETLWYVPLLIILPYGSIFWFLRTHTCRPIPYGGPLIVILILMFIPIRLSTRKIEDSCPFPHKFSIINSLHAFSGYCVKVLPQMASAETLPKYEPYKTTPQGSPSATIILVMGESFSSTHMSLYGYDRKTTPRLDAYKTDPHFIWKQGYSAGVSTKTSFPLVMNLIREPDNIEALTSKSTNLFKLAKKQGFHTVYISAQNMNLLNNVGSTFIDKVITLENEPTLFAKLKDEGLLEILKNLKIDFTQNNFIVLHQRNMHFPYTANYHHKKECQLYPEKDVAYKEFMINSYDNAMCFNDIVLSEIIHYFKDASPLPTYVFITSDHGEALGDNGKFGHSFLDTSVAKIPFILYEHNGNADFLRKVRSLENITHYELSVMLAHLMGYEVENPNAIEGIYYINANDLFGMQGYLELNKTKGTVEFKTIPPQIK